MTHSLIVKPAAEADVQEAFLWYENERSGLGGEFVRQLEDAFDQISARPYLHPTVFGDIRRVLTKRFPYNIYYVIEEQCVFVLAVMHASRDPARWQSRG